MTVEELQELISEIDALRRVNKYDCMENILLRYILERNVDGLIGTLRITSRYKDRVPGWDRALEAAERILEEEGEDPNEELEGLI